MNPFQDFSLLLLLFATSICGDPQPEENVIYFCESVPRLTPMVEIPALFTNENISLSFRPKIQDLECPKSSKVHHNVSVADEPSFVFLSSGDIAVQTTDFFLRSEFCIKRINADSIEIKTCEVKCGETHKCIHKCCHPHQIFDFSEGLDGLRCVSLANKTWKPVFYTAHEGCGIRVESDDLKYHIFQVPPGAVDPNPYKDIKFYKPDEDGTLMLEGLRFRLMRDSRLMFQQPSGKWESINHGEFCIDGMTGYMGSGGGVTYSHIKDQVFLTVLKNDSFYEDDDIFEDDAVQERLAEFFYIPLMLIGALFLLLTSLVYIFMWEKHNIHGWTIFAFVVTMLFMFIFLAATKILSISMYHEFGTTVSCKSIGILAHFFYLSTMCWLSVINLDLWLTFRNVKPGGGKSQNLTRFAFYSLFAFGVPLFIVTFGVVVDLAYKSSFRDGSECESPFTLPLYGVYQCYLQRDALSYYLYIPMTILLTSNILAFSSTVFSLCMYRNQSRNATSNTSNQNESIILFGKLFIVTGISWIFELISFMTPELWWLLIIFDAYNLLQAVLIFIIFALKRENLLFLFQKYPGARFLLGPIMRTRCCYAESFDAEQTDMTVAPFDPRHSKIHFRRTSRNSTSSASAYK